MDRSVDGSVSAWNPALLLHLYFLHTSSDPGCGGARACRPIASGRDPPRDGSSSPVLWSNSERHPNLSPDRSAAMSGQWPP